MARPGRTESASLPIWLKLSEADAAQLERVLARPEFAGWTRAEWCLEIIQTALRYYARRDSADEPTRERAAPRPAAPPGPAPEPPSAPGPPSAAPEPAPAAPKPKRAAPKPKRAAARAKPAAPRTERPAPERAQPQRPAPERAAPERPARERARPERAPGPTAAGPELPPSAPEPSAASEPGQDITQPVAEEPEPLASQDCSHPAEARDYQTGTCAACGAILWD
jgi:hypothetical protein